MIILACAFIGALIGAFTAKKRGGRGLDMLQYGAGYGIAFALVGLFLTVVIGRAVL
ncbi:MAG: hypothetical protein ACEQSU_06760 [Microgenomates group bacterium]